MTKRKPPTLPNRAVQINMGGLTSVSIVAKRGVHVNMADMSCANNELVEQNRKPLTLPNRAGQINAGGLTSLDRVAEQRPVVEMIVGWKLWVAQLVAGVACS
jgi:hypothetical protein